MTLVNALRRRLSKALRKHPRHGLFGVFSFDPPIFYGRFWKHFIRNGIDTGPLGPLFERLSDRDAWFVMSCGWTMEDREWVLALASGLRQHERRYPRHRFSFMCATEKETEIFRDAGLAAIYCNKNCLVDERIFRPQPEIEKRYDAIYDARLDAFKRHELAVEIESLALVTYLLGEERAYALRIRELLSHAHWLNDPFAEGYRKFTNTEVARAVNQAYTGLCLSAEEGGMFASIQYLLCGVPIVTTKSIGGRDVFFDERYVRWVPDDPTAVREAVAEFKAALPEPGDVRRSALTRVWEHRHRLIAHIDGIFREVGGNRSFAEDWDSVFSDKMTRHTSYKEVLNRIR